MTVISVHITKMESLSHKLKHRRDITGKRFRCAHKGCEKSFSFKGPLITHQRIHLLNNPLIIANERKLKRLSETKATDRPFRCDSNGCSKSFLSKSLFKQHRDKHSDKYLCDFNGCGYWGDRKQRLIGPQEEKTFDKYLRTV